MPRPSRHPPLAALALLGTTLVSGACSRPDAPAVSPADLPVIASAPATPRPPFTFSSEDSRLLDDIQRGCFLFFWHEVSPKTGMVFDRTSAKIVSVAGVGFQLSALPIGVERGWVSRQDAQERARLIVSTLAGNPLNRRHGLFYHYLDPDDAGEATGSYEHVVSTIDSAILFAGMITAGAYFGGEVARTTDQLLREGDWHAFVLQQSERSYEAGFISLGLKTGKVRDPADAGELLPYVWADAGDEQRLVSFLAVGAPAGDHAVDPALYYRLRRRLGSYADTGPFVWFPWSGALFTDFFAHCWIDYAARGPDDPARFGQAHRPRVDWWENSRRAVRMHQLKARENPSHVPTLGPDAWGLSASDAPEGYAVPGLFPDPLPMPGATPNVDYADHPGKDDYGDGTVAPYAAGSAVIFDPAGALAALRYYRNLHRSDGSALIWHEPDATTRDYGFRDAFNLGTNWVASDCVAIDEGPLLLCIENARTGLIWRLFGQSGYAGKATAKLGWKDSPGPSGTTR